MNREMENWNKTKICYHKNNGDKNDCAVER